MLPRCISFWFYKACVCVFIEIKLCAHYFGLAVANLSNSSTKLGSSRPRVYQCCCWAIQGCSMDFIAMRNLALKAISIVDIRIEMNRRYDNKVFFSISIWQLRFQAHVRSSCSLTIERSARTSHLACVCTHFMSVFLYFYFCLNSPHYRFIPCCFRTLFSVLFTIKCCSLCFIRFNLKEREKEMADTKNL